MTDSIEQRAPGSDRLVTIVGLGLLGGSLGLALRRHGWRVRGVVRRPEAAREAMDLGIADEVVCEAALGEDESAGAVVLAVPIEALVASLERFRGRLPRGTVITDVSSVKGAIMHDLDRLAAGEGWRFVGSHPMAGAETSGMASARADLFRDAWVAVCRGVTADESAVALVRGIWGRVGGRCLELDPQDHDRIVARTSHLPHLVAALLVLVGIGDNAPAEAPKLAAGGFRDSTRIAAGPPEMWRQIMQANHTVLGAAVRQFAAELSAAAALLEQGRGPELEGVLTTASELRRAWRGSGDPAAGEPCGEADPEGDE